MEINRDTAELIIPLNEYWSTLQDTGWDFESFLQELGFPSKPEDHKGRDTMRPREDPSYWEGYFRSQFPTLDFDKIEDPWGWDT